MSDDELLAAQVAYYRERAPSYDRLYDEARADPRVDAGYRGLAEFIRELRPAGAVLEVACGTGHWTGALLADDVTQLTAVDAAPEALAIHAERVRDPRVERLTADVFAWSPPRRYDLVFFGFWLSHVPSSRFAGFWTRVAAALAPGGLVAFIDSGPGEHRCEDWIAPGVVRRTLETGATHEVVKVLYEPRALSARLAALGWDAHVGLVGRVFLAGSATRALSDPAA
ncbi:MAG: class I SAM-dependent methyltransferase [Egibacteraceae bacterium]